MHGRITFRHTLTELGRGRVCTDTRTATCCCQGYRPGGSPRLCLGYRPWEQRDRRCEGVQEVLPAHRSELSGAKKPVTGISPSISARSPASWSGPENSRDPRPLHMNSSAPAARWPPSAVDSRRRVRWRSWSAEPASLNDVLRGRKFPEDRRLAVGRRGRRRGGRGRHQPGSAARTGRCAGRRPGHARSRGATGGRAAGRRADRPRVEDRDPARVRALRPGRDAAIPQRRRRCVPAVPELAARRPLHRLRESQAHSRTRRRRPACVRGVPPPRPRTPPALR